MVMNHQVGRGAKPNQEKIIGSEPSKKFLVKVNLKAGEVYSNYCSHMFNFFSCSNQGDQEQMKSDISNTSATPMIKHNPVPASCSSSYCWQRRPGSGKTGQKYVGVNKGAGIIGIIQLYSSIAIFKHLLQITNLSIYLSLN